MNEKRQWRTRGLGWFVALAVFGTVLVAFPKTASAAPGDTTYIECLRHSAQDRAGCAYSRPGLKHVGSTVTSPDGKFVYAIGDVVTTFSRNTSTGALTWLRCRGVGDGCLNGDGFKFVNEMVISPDGLNAYTTSPNEDRVNVFARDRDTGGLAYAGCVEDWVTPSGDCATAPGLDYPNRLTVTNSGQWNLYVTGLFSSSVVSFQRSLNGGGLRFTGCIGDSSRPRIGNCGIFPGLLGAGPIQVTPDGIAVYVGTANTLVPFDRSATTGTITPRECYGNKPSSSDPSSAPPSNCEQVPGLTNVSDIAVSPDSKVIYTTAWSSHAINHFLRAGDSSDVQLYRCMRDVAVAANGCDGAIYILSPGNAEVSPDGLTLYVSSYSSESLAPFTRNLSQAGRLYQGPCFLDAEHAGDGCTKVQGLAGASGLVVSPDARSVYVAGYVDNALTRFSREAVPGTGPDITAPDTVIDSGPRARSKSRKATFTFHSTEPGSRLICSLDNEPFQYCTSPTTRNRLSKGVHRFRVTSQDAAGNRDASPAVWKWRVVV